MASNGLQATKEQAERLHHYAHDLRNRLAGMQQALRMLSTPDPDLDPAELMRFGEQQYFKAMRLTEELLDDLAVARGTLHLETTAVDLVAATQAALALTAHRANKKEQTIQLAGSTALHAMADAHHLELLLTALISNASKFSGIGSTIHIRLMHQDQWAIVEVEDSGVGLSTKDLAHVFDRYAMLSSKSTAGEEQGRSTLARAAQWATVMGGTLVASSPGMGKGCTFSLRLLHTALNAAQG